MKDWTTIEVAGHTVVAPILREGAQLSRPVEDYFPDKDPEKWFAWSVEKQNAWVVKIFNGQCVFIGLPSPGETVVGHHIIKRSVAEQMARVPWNIIPVMMGIGGHDIHGNFHKDIGVNWRVCHWDWFDLENGLEVLDETTHRIPHEDLHFYKIPSPDRVAAAVEWEDLLLSAYRDYVRAGYALGALAAGGGDHVKALGAETVNSLAAQIGLSVSPLKIGKRVFDGIYEYWDAGEEHMIPLKVMDRIRKLPEEVRGRWVEQAKRYCSPLSPQPSEADFWELLNKEFPGTGRAKKVTYVPDGVKIETDEVETWDEALTQGKGMVIKGWPIGKE